MKGGRHLSFFSIVSSHVILQFTGTWVQVFRHMPEVQVCHDKKHHGLLLIYVEK